MATTVTTAGEKKAPTVETRVDENAYGELYEYLRCTGCGVEVCERWQLRAACDCGGQ